MRFLWDYLDFEFTRWPWISQQRISTFSIRTTWFHGIKRNLEFSGDLLLAFTWLKHDLFTWITIVIIRLFGDDSPKTFIYFTCIPMIIPPYHQLCWFIVAPFFHGISRISFLIQFDDSILECNSSPWLNPFHADILLVSKKSKNKITIIPMNNNKRMYVYIYICLCICWYLTICIHI